jgi:uncharacterized membrane protein
MSDAAVAILLSGIISYAYRGGGYWLMRFVPPTRRVRAVLQATPMAVIGAVVAPALARGGVAEWLALAVAALVMWRTKSEIVAMAAAMALVAAAQWLPLG